MIPYGRQDIDQADVDAVVQVLRSDFLTQGPAVPRFERALAEYCGVEHALAANSATSALHLACLALGLGPGDWLWTSPLTFVASANCALYCGASVDFVDVDARTANISVPALERKLMQAKRDGRLPKIVVPVHLAGEPCDLKAIRDLSLRFGFRVVEDASHAVGARYRGGPIGNCHFSDIAVFSFHPVKIITTAEGGMALTRDSELARRMALLRSHGITRDAAEMTHEPDGPWYYQQIALGYNYRMTDLQAALGTSQVARVDQFVARRHAIARRYDRLLAGLPLQAPLRAEGNLSSLHLYVVRVDAGRRRAAFEGLRARGVGVNLHYIPVHKQPFFKGLGVGFGPFPEAERYYQEAISLPLYPGLSDAQQDWVVQALKEVLKA